MSFKWFNFDPEITRMDDKGILYIVLQEFTSNHADFHPDHISNIEMGYVFEEIIRKFSESSNEDAGQHYTPREVIRLMVNPGLNTRAVYKNTSTCYT